ncbi:nucleotidyltransferase domain-containing protein [Nannocystis pusilla]|uniref:nucleotidyltransferase domain-containing protein n=1 Tax=Nannocystis pusilla TaxID=889268 RepID=UPI003BF512C6
MTILQTEFNKFNDAIRLGWDNEQATLRERRDAVLDRIRERLDGPSFSHFNQGSYELRTGVKPVDGDYDIDVGLRFNTTKEEWPDPVALKQRVVDALSGYKVELRRPCVTVYYQRRNEALYHVDLNVYVPAGTDGMFHLAVGKVGDAGKLKEWRYTDPLALSKAIDAKFTDDDREQCRRAIRCLKRWKDLKFSAEGNAAPKGIGLTAAALQWFAPSKERDGVANRVHYDDLRALSGLVSTMLANATPRLVVKLPVSPHDDLFRRMNDEQMRVFRDKLQDLDDGLRRALADADEGSASRTLRRFFGDDFPEVSKSSTVRRAAGAIVSSGSAG